MIHVKHWLDDLCDSRETQVCSGQRLWEIVSRETVTLDYGSIHHQEAGLKGLRA